MAWKRWEDWTNVVLGGWLIFAPSVFGLAGTAATVTISVGILVAAARGRRVG